LLRPITFVKSAHTLAFIALSVANLVVFYSALCGRVTPTTWVAMALVIGEGIILVLNGWRCPLTIYAEKLGAVSGQVTDIFLPKWLADRIFPICGGLLAFSMLLFIIRYLASRLGLFAPLQFTSIF
jgi:hypothetical protein